MLWDTLYLRPTHSAVNGLFALTTPSFLSRSFLVPAPPRRLREPDHDLRQRHVVRVDQHKHGAAAEGHRVDRRAQQAAVASIKDAAGDLRSGQAHLVAEEGNQGQGGAAEGKKKDYQRH
jgi:hypothetical protein